VSAQVLVSPARDETTQTWVSSGYWGQQSYQSYEDIPQQGFWETCMTP
jgi:hypothetical protein